MNFGRWKFEFFAKILTGDGDFVFEFDDGHVVDGILADAGKVRVRLHLEDVDVDRLGSVIVARRVVFTQSHTNSSVSK